MMKSSPWLLFHLVVVFSGLVITTNAARGSKRRAKTSNFGIGGKGVLIAAAVDVVAFIASCSAALVETNPHITVIH